VSREGLVLPITARFLAEPQRRNAVEQGAVSSKLALALLQQSPKPLLNLDASARSRECSCPTDGREGVRDNSGEP